ncbi:T9SS type A sorting domain-containing protein [Flavobacterium psychrophilum]
MFLLVRKSLIRQPRFGEILEINVSSFAKGNYFVEVMTNQGKATKTIIIQ